MQLLSSLFVLPTRRPKPSIEARLQGERVILRAGEATDWRNWRNLREHSRGFLTPWEPAWPSNATTYGFFCGMLRRQWREWRDGKTYNFLIFLRDPERQGPGALIGGIALSDIHRGIAQVGTLGYWLGEPYTGHGYMREAAELVTLFAFETLKLHRIEASCLPHNEPSKNLLTRLGFEQEGYARQYLQINGFWQDHLLWGKVWG